ncbi:MAG: D-glycerate dehydrogenase [Armatimonadota bacterium]|nr:D-glycerate dehydrogenase [Armatimonadota bacterium]MDR7451225.1 D-glycerate dehydrogenase [Armatimonadota bacterium]MDR7466872.1 D-glycerate dehydrogenase [Armatimonadota bacterium]MDR7492655.1 D-glycerate dehydrogenase [Armatimonadota bacterium]MDR7499983.1 D-glycerate dehydrogenase [Armatimonadota bacterium]
MARPKVYVCRRIPEAALEIVRGVAEMRLWDREDVPPPRDVLLQEAAECDGLLTLLTDRVDGELLARAPRLRVVANMAVGFDNIDVAAATARGVVVTNTPEVLTETTADFAFALILAAARRLVEADAFTRAGRWKTWGPLLLAGQDVHHATLGLIGVGRIGSAVARRARGFEMRILYYDTVRRHDLERQLGLEFRELNDVLREADIISVHVPLTPQTRHLIGREQFRMMKKTAVFVNAARGPIVDQAALVEALRTRTIYAAGLDVFEQEPIAPDDPLLTLDNVVVAPHIASASIPTRTRMATLAAENLAAVLQGRRPPTPVNPEVLDRPS